MNTLAFAKASMACLMAVVLFLGGVQLVALGVIGEYLGRIYNESKHRPLYLIAETDLVKVNPGL